MTDQRGGIVIKTGKIGRTNILRQQLLMPGETINTNITGRVALESTRERETLRINGHLATFLTPLRWLVPNFPTYLREGPDTAETIPTYAENDLSSLGIGAFEYSVVTQQFWRDAVLKIYNEWYKWPEDPDKTAWEQDGLIAVPLQATWNRCRYKIDPDDTSDYTVPSSAADFDVRALSEIQAKFRSAMERDVLSYNRWMELVKEMFGQDGSREVDKVPIKIDETTLGVNPREIPATDSAGLGDWQSIYDFGIDHGIKGITAPEHCVLTYVLTLRFAPVIEGRNPHSVEDLTWVDLVGDPEITRNMRPQNVRRKDVETFQSTTSLGYQPSGWRWRNGWDVLGKRIDLADSFPMMIPPSTKEMAKDATRIREAFRSQALGDYLCDLQFSERSRNLHGSALESYFGGMTGSSSKSEAPKQGKML